MMRDLSESIASSMGCSEDALPYLDYILQDLRTLGSNPDIILNTIKEFFANPSELRLLDVGCGKGSCTVEAAKEGIDCVGIDAMEPFIDEARSNASVSGVMGKCEFIQGDAGTVLKTLGSFDVVLLGSVGPILGELEDSLNMIRGHVRDDGILILDEGRVVDIQEIMDISERCGFTLVRECLHDPSGFHSEYDEELTNIEKRCQELIRELPHKANVFLNYLESQKEEYEFLKTSFINSTMVFKPTRKECV